MKRLLHLIVVCTVFNLHLLAQEKGTNCLPIRDISQAELTFKDGERLTYVANYIWGAMRTEVAELTAVVRYEPNGSEPAFFASADVKTHSFFDIFFKIRDHYEGRFRARNLTPLYFHRDIHEGKYTIQNHYYFQNDHSVRARITRSGGNVKDTIMQGRPCTFDLISLLYFARNIEMNGMASGAISPLSFLIDAEMYDLYFRYEGVENKKIQGLGTFRCKKFSGSLVAGVVFSGKEEMAVWISDDANRLPLLIESPIIVGKIAARLAKIENSKFPLTSKLK